MKNNNSLLQNLRQVLLYGVNGIINTAATYALYLLFSLLVDYRIAIALAYIPGIFLSYHLNGKFVFNTRGSLIRFVAITIAMFIINLSATWFFVEYVGIAKEIAQVIAIGLVFIFGFALNKKYSFVQRKNFLGTKYGNKG